MRAAIPLVFLVSVTFAGCMIPDTTGPETEADPGDPFAHMTGFQDPVLVTHAGDGSGRLFVVEQEGRIMAVAPDGERSEFADLRFRVESGGEEGLLGLAFHPDFAANGVFLVSYTDPQDYSVIERFRTGEDGAIDLDTGEEILRIKQPYSNHNGGHLLYGPDGYLYAGFGDGGSSGDPKGHGQRKGSMLGAILRIDVGATGDYSIPADNPFDDGVHGAPEVWVYGLRNPWRFSFDPAGNLWIGDVGQGSREEIDRLTPQQSGANLGWNEWEGTVEYPSGRPFDPKEDKDAAEEMTFPVAEYNHKGGRCSVTGGEAVGEVYVFADYCTGTIWTMPLDGGLGSATELRNTDYNISSFGRDEDGNVYLIDHGGTVERFSLDD